MKRLLSALSCLLALAAACGCDSKPTITIICPWAAGGGTDTVSRFWAGALEQELGQRVVVSNKTGGSGATGHTAGARARPDGNTITMITFELSTMREMGINAPTRADFKPVIQVNADAAAIVVRDDAPWKSLQQLLAHVKAHPGELVMTGTATGGAWDLARAGLLQAAGLPVDAVVWKPNQGAAPSLTDLMGGHVGAVCCSVPEVKQTSAENLRVLAVMSQERLQQFPDIPTAREQGVDWVAVGWRGLAVPKDTPDEVVERLYKACRKIADSDEYREFMNKPGYTIEIRDPKQFAAFLEQQDALWKPVVEAAGYAKEPS